MHIYWTEIEGVKSNNTYCGHSWVHCFINGCLPTTATLLKQLTNYSPLTIAVVNAINGIKNNTFNYHVRPPIGTTTICKTLYPRLRKKYIVVLQNLLME